MKMNSKSIVLAGAVVSMMMLTMATRAQESTNRDDEKVAQRVLDGVSAIAQPGTVGQIAVWGEHARPLVLGKSGDTQRPIAALATLERGRIIAFAHGYAGKGAASKHDTARLLANACDWLCEPLAMKQDSPRRIGLLKSDLAALLRERGFEIVSIKGGAKLDAELRQANVQAVVTNSGDLSQREVAVLGEFVRSGGGLMCATCPWGWAQVQKKEVDQLPLNRLLERAGLAFTEGTVDATIADGFSVNGIPGPEFHGMHAIDMLMDVESTKRTAKDAGIAQAGATLQHVAGVLPADDGMLRPRLEGLLSDRADRLAPTSQKPLRANQPLDRALLAMQVSELERAPRGIATPHPAAAAFPGAVPTDAPRINKTVTIDARIPNWHSTGLYAAPGESIAVSFIGDAAAARTAGLRIRIGCHNDQLWHHNKWDRVPRITRSWLLDEDTTIVANPFGGLMYIEVPNKAGEASFTVRIEGAVESPFFVLGETTNAQWVSAIRNAPGPWAELACNRLILTVPTDVARGIDDPHSLMQHWVKVLDADADLAAISRERTSGWARPERIVADVQISAGYMHSGYPIMTHLDAAPFMTNLDKLLDHGWGPYHELGHNHQHRDWTFGGTTEVTCNLFTLYVMEMVTNVPPSQSGRVLNDKSFAKMAQHLETDGKWERWKKDPFLALQMYMLMQREFGWDAYKKVFAEYRELTESERPKNDDQKRDQWLTRFSRTVGKNLGPYFEAWGVPTSEQARASINDLPIWMPEEMIP